MFKFDVAAIIRAVRSPLQLLALGTVLMFLLALFAMAGASSSFDIGKCVKPESSAETSSSTRASSG